jgi:hypothetical protein
MQPSEKEIKIVNGSRYYSFSSNGLCCYYGDKICCGVSDTSLCNFFSEYGCIDKIWIEDK